MDAATTEAARNVTLLVLAQALVGGTVDPTQCLRDVRAQAWEETLTALTNGVPGIGMRPWAAQTPAERKRTTECAWIYRRCSTQARLVAVERGGGTFRGDVAWVDPNDIAWPSLLRALLDEDVFTPAVRAAWRELERTGIAAGVRGGALALPEGVGGLLMMTQMLAQVRQTFEAQRAQGEHTGQAWPEWPARSATRH